MKRNILTIILVMTGSYMFAQYGYRYKKEYIKLNVDSSMCFIQTSDDKTATIRNAEMNIY